jgi:hypothetical protein
MHIFLDDERVPGMVTWVTLPNEDWVTVRNYQEFVDMVDGAIENEVDIDFVSFDHDLADEHYCAMLKEQEYNDGRMVDYGIEKTGYDCAKYLGQVCINNNLPLPDFAVHSLNRIGGKRITDYLELVRKHIEDDGA